MDLLMDGCADVFIYSFIFASRLNIVPNLAHLSRTQCLLTEPLSYIPKSLHGDGHATGTQTLKRLAHASCMAKQQVFVEPNHSR